MSLKRTLLEEVVCGSSVGGGGGLDAGGDNEDDGDEDIDENRCKSVSRSRSGEELG